MEDNIKERLEKYLKITEKAIEKVKLSKNPIIKEDAAKEILEMAKRYYEIKMSEWDDFRLHVSDWERERYLEVY